MKHPKYSKINKRKKKTLEECKWKRESRVYIYKTCIRPKITSAETKLETKNVKEICAIKRNRSTKKNKDTACKIEYNVTCNVQDIVRWTRDRRRHGTDYVLLRDYWFPKLIKEWHKDNGIKIMYKHWEKYEDITYKKD